VGAVLATGLVLFLALPLVALFVSASPAEIRAGAASPLFGPAIWLSMRTTLVSLFVILVAGTPLAWWIATSSSRAARVIEVVVDLPIVIPPAVVGVALLRTWGRQGLFGPVLQAIGLSVPFTEQAVLTAQIVVAAPFFVQAAANAFRKVDADTLIVARTLGASSNGAFFRVAIPIAMPGLVVGASLAWARALGEFGATLLFAGNLSGRTQTMPLAILTALESDVRVALVFSLILAAVGTLLLVGLRLAPPLWASFAGSRELEQTELGGGSQ
jgi:molybdate transport system permease protein